MGTGMNILTKLANQILKLHGAMKKRRKTLVALGCVVVFITTYALILPAITMDQNHTDEGMSVENAGETAEGAGTDGQAVTEETAAAGDTAQADDSAAAEEDTSAGNGSDDAAAEQTASANAAGTLTYDGKDYHVTLTYGEDAGIPSGAEISATELDPNSDEYQTYFESAKQAYLKESGEEEAIGYQARFFDIRIMSQGAEIEPAASVQVQITYDQPVEKSVADDMKAVHFVHDDAKEAEVLPVKTETGETGNRDEGSVSDIRFTQESFSITGTIAPVETPYNDANSDRNWPLHSDGDKWLMILTDDDINYYAVKNDGSLVQVDLNKNNSEDEYNWVATIDGNSADIASYEWNLTQTENNQYARWRKLTTNDGATRVDPRSSDGFSTSSTGYVFRTDYKQLGTAYYLTSDASYLYYYIGMNSDHTKMVGGLNSTNCKVYFARNPVASDSDINTGGDSGETGGEDPGTVEPNLNVPEIAKTLTSNEDGTYDLSLSVKGTSAYSTIQKKADIVIIYDTSTSMYENTVGSEMRKEISRRSVNELAETLLGNNTESAPDAVRLALVSFDNTAAIQQFGSNSSAWTTEVDEYTDKVDFLTDNIQGGFHATNWEDAFIKALSLSTRDDAETFYVFVSDGNPTFRVTKGELGGTTNYPEGYVYTSETRYEKSGLYGNGYDSGTNHDVGINIEKSYNAAVPQAQKLASEKNGKVFCVSCYMDDTETRMQELTAAINSAVSGSASYYNAADEASLNEAFSSIANEITRESFFRQVKITDGITKDTSSYLEIGNGDVTQFTYSIQDDEGNSLTREEEKLPEATFTQNDDGTQTVVWDLTTTTDGEEYELKNGYTYEVSFTVWPSQEAYDTLAGLNNGTIQWEDVDQTQYVREENGDGTYTYSLKTNTSATLDYTGYSRYAHTKPHDGSEESFTPGTLTYDDPDPMPLVSDKIQVVKIWESDEDREKLRGSSVDLELYCGSELVHTFTLSSDNDWKSTEYWYVAPGLKVGEDGSLETLDSGHVYTLKEASGSTNENYTFSSETVSPFLINSAEEITWDGAQTAGVITGTNKLNDAFYKVIIQKVSSTDTGTGLAGAEFKLYSDESCTQQITTDGKGNPIGDEGTLTTGEDGQVEIGDLKEGVYYLKETKAPNGYQLLSEPIKITITRAQDPIVQYAQDGNSKSTDNSGVTVSEDGSTYTLMITNTAGKALPSTGGSGTFGYKLSGLLLLAIAIVAGFGRRARGRRVN